MTLSDSATAQLWETFRAGGGAGLIREAVELLLQELIEAEAAEAIGAGRYRVRPSAQTAVTVKLRRLPRPRCANRSTTRHCPTLDAVTPTDEIPPNSASHRPRHPQQPQGGRVHTQRHSTPAHRRHLRPRNQI